MCNVKDVGMLGSIMRGVLDDSNMWLKRGCILGSIVQGMLADSNV